MNCVSYYNDKDEDYPCVKPYKWVTIFRNEMDAEDLDAYQRGYNDRSYRKNMFC